MARPDHRDRRELPALLTLIADAALDAGANPATVAAWIAETEARQDPARLLAR